MKLLLSGKLFSGMGKGKYYVGHQEYQKRFEQALGYRPYPGTLNVKLEDAGSLKALARLRGAKGTGIPGFMIGSESFSALKCFQGEVGGEAATLLIIDITYYNDSVVELISSKYLRGACGLKDGDTVRFETDDPVN